MSPRLKSICLTLGLVLPVLMVVLFYGPIFRYFMPGEVPHDPGLPPAFSGNRAAYGSALFSMFSMSALSLRKMISLGFEMLERDFFEELDLNLYRLAIFALLTLVLIGTSPDVALMLLWGEVSEGTIVFFMTVDRVLDGLGIAPFLFAVLFLTRAEQLSARPASELEALVVGEASAPSARARAFYEIVPRGESFRETLKVVGMIFVIAFTLTLLK